MPTYIPKMISRVEGMQTKGLITSEYWNEIFNLLIEQGNYNTAALKEVLQEGTWSLGHVIKDEEGVSFGRKRYLKFLNTTVSETEDTTIIGLAVGPAGPVGPRGLPSPSLIFKGRFLDVASLQAAHPTGNIGDVYAVGPSNNILAYGWDDDAGAWVDLGALTGVPGIGIPSGGSTSQVLIKNSATDYDTTWGTITLPNELMHLTGLNVNIKDKFNLLDTALSNVQSTISLSASKVVVSGADGKLSASTLSSDKLGHLSDVTSSIQAQLDGKLGSTAKAANSSKIDGRTIFVGSSAPSAAINGDIWFKV